MEASVAQFCFILPQTTWGISTLFALYYAFMKKNGFRHRNWMIRSFALALSALSLRTWKLALYQIQPIGIGLHQSTFIKLEAWLGWTIKCI